MLDSSVHSAITRLIQRRADQGTISTGRVIQELRDEFDDLPYSQRDLEFAIAKNAISIGLQVKLEAEANTNH